MQRVDLGGAGLAYVRERVGNGLTLSALVNRALDLDEGRVSTWLPAELTASPPALGSGGIMRTRDSTGLALGLVRGYFADHPQAALWVEECLPRRSDPFWQNVPETPPGWFLGEEVYSLGFAEDDDDRLAQVLANIGEYPGWGGGGFLSTASASQYRDRHDLTSGSLTAVANAVTHIICGAFDGEGYLVWQRA